MRQDNLYQLKKEKEGQQNMAKEKDHPKWLRLHMQIIEILVSEKSDLHITLANTEQEARQKA